jgi:ABC-type antimicrobial peptide transport system permease subunit
MLYNVGPRDPLSFGVATLTVTGMAAIATIVLAIRATRVDPIVAMRVE